MRGLFCKTLLYKTGFLIFQKGNPMVQHVVTKVIVERRFLGLSLPTLQPCVFMSQKTTSVTLDDPSLMKYVVSLLNENVANKNWEKPPYWNRLKELMDQRDLILKNINSVNELKLDEGSKELGELADEEFDAYQSELAGLDLEVLRLLLPKNMHESYSDVMVEISSGAGGQEAMLFANELLKLYENYASLRGWTFIVESVDNSDLGGIRSASIFIHGAGAFQYMQNEIGVHRVQRVPITSSAGMVHTSTAAVIVMPQPTEVDIKLADKDLLIETKRASGPGGQNVNKTESAVRIKHLPTGIAVECQENQSQLRNKSLALLKLRTKLYDIEVQKQNKTIRATRQSQMGNRDRSEKIRTYNFPQNRVTDHRCHITSHNIKEIMEGGNAYHNFLEKLIEKNEEEAFLQFVASIRQK